MSYRYEALDAACSRMPAAVPPAENGAPRSELEQLQLKAGQVTDEVSFVENYLSPGFYTT